MDKVSFLPEDYQKKRLHRRTNVISIALFTVVMGVIVMAFAATDRQRSEVRAELVEINEKFEEAARRLEQLDELRDRKKQIIRKANVTAALLERVPRSLVLAELINHMPGKVSLLDLDMKTTVVKVRRMSKSALQKAKDKKKKDKEAGKSELDLPKIQPSEVTLQLTGVADTDVQVAAYMHELGASSMFQDVNLAYSKEKPIDKVVMREFRIDMKLNQEVNPHKIKPLRVPRWGQPAAVDAGMSGEAMDRLTSVDSNSEQQAPASVGD